MSNKEMKSFRLSEKTIQDLQVLSEKANLSQADLIEALVRMAIHMESYILEDSKNEFISKPLQKEYARLFESFLPAIH